jgi:hypothetical protein
VALGRNCFYSGSGLLYLQHAQSQILLDASEKTQMNKLGHM